MALPRRVQSVLHAFSPVTRIPGGPIIRTQTPVQRLSRLQYPKRLRHSFLDPKKHGEQRTRGGLNSVPEPQLDNSIPENTISYNRTQSHESGLHNPRIAVGYAEQIGQEAKANTQYWRPFVFASMFSFNIYIILSYWDAKEQIKEEDKAKAAPQLPLLGGMQQPQRYYTPTEFAKSMWYDLKPVAKVTFGIMGANGIVSLVTSAVPKYREILAHTPAFNNPLTLVTSTFTHHGFWHLAVNTWACYTFLIPSGFSPLFNGNPYHLFAFYLSTGALSGYGQHLATLPAKASSMAVLTRSAGASGALFGAFAVFCMQFPNAQVGIILLPFSFAAINMLPAAMLFDLVGAIRGFNLGMGHAVSFSNRSLGTKLMLTGSLIGCSHWRSIFVLQRQRKTLGPSCQFLEETNQIETQSFLM